MGEGTEREERLKVYEMHAKVFCLFFIKTKNKKMCQNDKQKGNEFQNVHVKITLAECVKFDSDW